MICSPDPIATPGVAEVLAGGGEMGASMRSFQWAATSLGPVMEWPQSLRTAVSICLSSRFPMIVLWGPELIQMYNDAYLPILGANHPRSLGQPTRECWPEVWEFNAPIYSAVVERGEETYLEDQLFRITRNGYMEDAYFTACYSAIRDESARVGGVLVTVLETTNRVLTGRRLRTLRELAAHVSTATTALEACATAALTLAGNPTDLPFALLYLTDSSGDAARLVEIVGLESGQPIGPGVIDLRSGTASLIAGPLGRALATGQVELVSSLDMRGAVRAHANRNSLPHSALILPLLQAGSGQPIGLLVSGISPHRALDEEYRGFFDLVAHQIAAAVAAGRASQNERLRELERAAALEVARVAVALERGRLLRIFQQAPAMIALLEGPDHVYVFANPLYERVSGRAGATLIGRTVRAAFPELADQGIYELLDEVYRSGEPFFGKEVPLQLDRHSDGIREATAFTFVYQPMRRADGDQRVEGILIYAVEVTELVRALVRAEGAQQTAEAAVRLRNDFLTVAAHDLRSPLTNIFGRAELMAMCLEPGSVPDLAWLAAQLGSLVTSARRLLATVDEFNDMTLVEMGEALELDIENIDVEELARAVADEVAAGSGAQSRGVSTVIVNEYLAVSTTVIVAGDRGRLGRVLQNVIGNAVKYSSAGTPVYVEVRASNGFATIVVRDQGVGIPDDEIARVFERFYRASTARGIQGSGIGLAGAQAIVTQHGGTITLQSTEGAGTTVTISLPSFQIE